MVLDEGRGLLRPKISVQARDAIGARTRCRPSSSIPRAERFEMEYIGADNVRHRRS